MHRKAFLFTLLLLISAAVALAPQKCTAALLELTASAKQMGQYERVEFTLQGVPAYANPFDPDEADVTLEVTGPGGVQSIPAFYFQDYERQQRAYRGRPSEWLYPVGPPLWKARFAPAATGSYTCVARVRDRSGVAQSNPVAFACAPSQRKGYVRVAARDPRFLALDDGSPFFPIGQNVAFVTNSYATINAFRQIAANGGNFARVWTCCADWGMALEARKSAWAKSWEWNPPVVLMPGGDSYFTDRKCIRLAGAGGTTLSLSPTRPLALRPNTRYTVTGKARTAEGAVLGIEVNGNRLGEALAAPGKWLAFKREFTTPADCWWLNGASLRLGEPGTAWLADLSLREAGDGPELLEEADVNRPILGCYNLPDCFVLDKLVEAAEVRGIRLQLCVLTRDLYMDLLMDPQSPAYERAIRQATHLLRYAVARWGYSPSIAVWEYFNEMDPGRPTGKFYAELGKYLDRVDIYRHLRASSAWAPAPNDWRNPALDTADLHYYLRPAEGELWKDEVRAVLARAKLVRENAPGKPALFNEYGMTEDNWQHSRYQDQDRDYTHLHNGLWASALSGLAGAVSPWFWEDIEKYDGYRHYQPLASFLADLPFTTAKLRNAAVTLSHPKCRAVGLQGSDCAYLWFANGEATWWKLAVEKHTPVPAAGRQATLAGLAPGRYRVQWWDTYTGKILNQEEITAAGEGLTLKLPTFTKDIACKVTR